MPDPMAGYNLGHGLTQQGAAVADAAAATAVAFPPGGTGAAAGGWDTAGNRDLAIARFTALLADVADLRTKFNALAARCRAAGIIET